MLATLVLCAGVFVFLGREARAKQPELQPTVADGYAAIADGNRPVAVVEPATETLPDDIVLVEAPLTRMPFAGTPTVSVTLPTEEPADQIWIDPTPPVDQPVPEAVLFDRYDPGATDLATPQPGMPVKREPVQASELVPGSADLASPATGQFAFEKNEPPLLPAGEKPLVGTPKAGVRPASLPGSGANGAVPVVPPPSVSGRSALVPGPFYPGSLPVGPNHPSSFGTAVGSTVEAIQGAAVDAADVKDILANADAPGSVSTPASSTSSGTEDSSEDKPQPEQQHQPSSPFAPPAGGSSFSLSGGQAGPGNGLAPLLVCILASGVILLRRDGLLRWASCEPPKPSSALLAPLERPG